MKITGIEPFIVSTFHKNAKRHWLIFKLLTDEGIFGLGDASLHNFDNQLISILEEWVERYLVGHIEERSGDLDVISPTAPLGAALIGARPGDVVSFEAPTGELRVRVLEVEAA